MAAIVRHRTLLYDETKKASELGEGLNAYASIQHSSIHADNHTSTVGNMFEQLSEHSLH